MTRIAACARSGCEQHFQAAAWSSRKYCSRTCAYESFKAREAEKRAEKRVADEHAREQDRQARLRWKPGPWYPPAAWDSDRVPDRPDRVMPPAIRIAEFWNRRSVPFDVKLQSPACFACGMKHEDWGLLERAHLVARACAGLDHEANLAMLCRSCHHFQPDCDPTGEQAIIYIRMGGWLGLALCHMLRYGTLDSFTERVHHVILTG